CGRVRGLRRWWWRLASDDIATGLADNGSAIGLRDSINGGPTNGAAAASGRLRRLARRGGPGLDGAAPGGASRLGVAGRHFGPHNAEGFGDDMPPASKSTVPQAGPAG